MIEKLEILAAKYAEKYPNEESVFGYFQAFGAEALISILNGSNGQKIIFTEGEGADEVTFEYV